MPQGASQAIIGDCVPSDAGGGGGGGTYRSAGVSTQPSELKGKAHGRTSNLVFSAIILCIPIPTPSITAKSMAHPIAEFLAAFIPPLIASEPPVKKPAITARDSGQHDSIPNFFPCAPRKAEAHILALYGSSFFLIPFTAQSKVENNPPHTPKLPPRTGARAFMAVMAPMRRSP